MKEHDGNIKELRKYITKHKKLYGQYAMSYTYLSYFDAKIKGHMSELQTLTTRLQQPKIKIEYSKNDIEKIHNAIRSIEFDEEKVIRIFSVLKEYLTPKIVILQRQLEECLAAKALYNKFSYSDLSMVEMTSYAPCMLISISDTVKQNQNKEVE